MEMQESGEAYAPEESITIIRGDVGRSEDVLELLREAAGWMESNGIKQWTPGQFNSNDITGYFSSREVYFAVDGDTLAGMFTLQFSDPLYWGNKNDENYAYLHRLTVAVPYRGLGLGERMLSFARLTAQERGCLGLRLDTVAHNVKLNRFYQSMGFRFMGMNEMDEGRLVNLYEYKTNHEVVGSDSLFLRYFGEQDFEYLKQWSISPEYLKQWAGPSLSYPLDDRQLSDYIAGANHPAKSDKLIYCAVLGAGGQVAGHLSLSAIDRVNGSARIGRVVVDPGLQGRGIGLRMIQEVVRIGFEGLGLHRISLGAFSFNTAALKCYETAGFTREGVSREAALFGGQHVDCIEMSILDREWRAIRQSQTLQ